MAKKTKSIDEMIKSLTLEEKASLCSGADFWHTEAIESKGIPGIMVSDGPHGLRKQNLEEEDCELSSSIKAVCFPTAASLAASFDTNLVEKVGEALGEECQAENVAVLLGPGNNIKRSPVCGRNFEYFSEDPFLAGKIAAAHIRGVQSKGVGTSLKHFAANNQEFARNTSDSVIDERTLREIYLTGFEIAVKESKPWTIMCSYNKINGVQQSENKYVLSDILRDEWGYEGLVMSDWGAVKDRAKCIAAGLDLEMPGCGKANDSVILDAIKGGTLTEAELDICVKRVLELVFKSVDNHDDSVIWDKKAHHLLAKSVAAECMVLLKNEQNVLPLEATDRVLIVGGYAKEPRFQGGGSSHINCTQIDSALASIQGSTRISYEKGFDSQDDSKDEKLFARAVEKAKNVDKCVIFAGLPDSYEVEGYERFHMDIPAVQNELIEEISKVCNHVIVVLHNGSPVTMPWIDKVDAVLEAYLAGQGTGSAAMDVLFGRVNPSAKLAETFPIRLEDNPAYLDFGEGSLETRYSEGVFAGYRYYTARKMPVLFPFGYGLSYTKFEPMNLRISAIDADGNCIDNASETDAGIKSIDDAAEVSGVFEGVTITDEDRLQVSLEVENIGKVKGKEVVQLYVAPPKGKVRRPVRELKGFAKVEVEPKQRKGVTITLDKRAFAYYDTEISDWYVEPGIYKIQICADAETVLHEIEVKVVPSNPKKKVYTVNSLYGDVYEDEKATGILNKYVEKWSKKKITTANAVAGSFEVLVDARDPEGRFLADMPLRSLVNLGDGRVMYDELMEFIDELNSL